MGVDFGRIRDRFGELFGTLKAPKSGKRGGRKTVEQRAATKRRKNMQTENGSRRTRGPRPCAPLQELSRTADSRPTGPDLQDAGPVFGLRDTPLRALRARWRIPMAGWPFPAFKLPGITIDA